jgi:hypothetical protein
MEPIILTLDNPDYKELFDGEERWQKSLEEDLVGHLARLGNQARKYAVEFKAGNLTVNQMPMHAHDTIFVSGGRGSGKTIFLKNSHKMWKEFINKQREVGELPRLEFLMPIDPTLLINHDNFTNVVVASLFNRVSVVFEGSVHVKEQQRSEFYLKLKKLAEALGQESDYQDKQGLDRIVQYTSGIQVERLFHDFVLTCNEILGVNAIVIPIDDVDMALSKAFEVLDVVRRMLACPLIIPIVSGDELLYQKVVERHFIESLSLSKPVDLAEIVHKLKEAYLMKIFPYPYRVSLKSVDVILENLEIKQEGFDTIPFSRRGGYEDKFKETFFGLTNGEERSVEYPKPSNAREIVQFIKILPPSKLQGAPDWQSLEALRVWAQSKHHGAAYVHAVSAQELISRGSDTLIRFDQLLAFNPLKQSRLNLPWASKKFDGDLDASINSNTYNSIDFGTNHTILGDVFQNNVLKSMPPLECHSLAMTISNKEIKDTNLVNESFFYIYTYKEYYGPQANRFNKVFFSRAFEILASSLLIACDMSSQHTQKTFEQLVRDTLNRPPFYCVHAMNPTKYAPDDKDESDQEVIDSQLDDNEFDNTNEGNYVSRFSIDLADWYLRYKNKIEQISSANLIPLLSAVFNKVFTQLAILKRDHNKLYDEHLTDSIRRFEYIVVNAFASFLIKGSVIAKANIATSADPEIIRNYANFITKEHVFTRNVSSLVDIRTGLATVNNGQDNNSALLLEAIWHHPVFTRFNNEDFLVVLKPVAKFSGRAIQQKIKNSLAENYNDRIKKPRKNSKPLRSLLSVANVKNHTLLRRLIENDATDSLLLNLRKAAENEMKKNNIELKDLSQTYREILKLINQKVRKGDVES